MDDARQVFRISAFVMQALPGALLFGAAIGICLRWIKHKRLLVYSVLVWPILINLYGIYRIYMFQNSGWNAVAWELSYLRGEHAIPDFIVYLLFFLVTFTVNILMRYAVPHGLPPQNERHGPI